MSHPVTHRSPFLYRFGSGGRRPAPRRRAIGFVLVAMVIGLGGAVAQDRAEEAPETEPVPGESAPEPVGAPSVAAPEEGIDPADLRVPPGSAKERVLSVVNALRTGDRETFLAGFDYGAAERPLVEGIIDFSIAALKFREKFVNAYGLEQWALFQSSSAPPEHPGHHDFRFSHVDDGHIEEIQRINAAEMEKRGTVRLPNTENDARLVQKNGTWLIDAKTLLPPNQEIQHLTGLLSLMTDIVKRYTRAISPDVPPQHIDYDMGLALESAVRGNPGDKFLIDPEKLKE